MNGVRLANYVAILDQLAEVLAGVGVGNLVDLVGVKPDLALAALEHAGSELLLKPEIYHSKKQPTAGFEYKSCVEVALQKRNRNRK